MGAVMKTLPLKAIAMLLLMLCLTFAKKLAGGDEGLVFWAVSYLIIVAAGFILDYWKDQS